MTAHPRPLVKAITVAASLRILANNCGDPFLARLIAGQADQLAPPPKPKSRSKKRGPSPEAKARKAWRDQRLFRLWRLHLSDHNPSAAASMILKTADRYRPHYLRARQCPVDPIRAACFEIWEAGAGLPGKVRSLADILREESRKDSDV